jgi:hypothetical protein
MKLYNMKRTIFLLSWILLLGVNAQTDKRRVMASAGRIAKPLNPSIFGGNYSLSYTLGEPFIYVNTPVGYTTTRMCNGFQQPDALIPVGPGVVVLMPTQPVFKIYPNPFDAYSIIEAPKEYEDQELKLQLIDANGKLVYDEIMKGARHKADYSTGLAPGTYFLNIYQITGEFIHQVKLIKS